MRCLPEPPSRQPLGAAVASFLAARPREVVESEQSGAAPSATSRGAPRPHECLASLWKNYTVCRTLCFVAMFSKLTFQHEFFLRAVKKICLRCMPTWCVCSGPTACCLLQLPGPRTGDVLRHARRGGARPTLSRGPAPGCRLHFYSENRSVPLVTTKVPGVPVIPRNHNHPQPVWGVAPLPLVGCRVLYFFHFSAISALTAGRFLRAPCDSGGKVRSVAPALFDIPDAPACAAQLTTQRSAGWAILNVLSRGRLFCGLRAPTQPCDSHISHTQERPCVACRHLLLIVVYLLLEG